MAAKWQPGFLAGSVWNVLPRSHSALPKAPPVGQRGINRVTVGTAVKKFSDVPVDLPPPEKKGNPSRLSGEMILSDGISILQTYLLGICMLQALQAGTRLQQ